ncbi:TetR/AcrR family transcriptional regulator [Nocardiopsis sp. B62]|uniref:TetR/AcrR family transcriptional regulator n=1 Tax=Nocardiopsis sp. B62 TaxID=2824874 RepID=UPI0027DB05C2|nr:TetR/AcrR family transcriptional regulator [Nocardiopsis sp. B62]
MAGQALSRERIVEVAIELADAEGLDSVSMRRVAKQLGAGTMSLYRHVSDKEELLREMIDSLHSRHAYPDPGDLDWRGRMRLLARHDWRMYTAHPWLLTATATLAPPAGPHMLASMEWALGALEPLRLTPGQAGRAIMTVTHYLQGSARLALADPAGGSGARESPGDGPGEAWRGRLGGDDLSAFPRVAALVASAPDDGATRGDDWVMTGLEMVLDGIAAQSGRAPA